MYCTKCGFELSDRDVFCSRCGARTGLWTVAEPSQAHVNVLRLDKRNKRIAGVCAGFARYFGVDIVLMRVIWLVIAFGTGVGFLVYLAAWIAIPSDWGPETQVTPYLAPRVPERR